MNRLSGLECMISQILVIAFLIRTKHDSKAELLKIFNSLIQGTN